MTETWKPIPGASRYEVSDQGRVRSLVRGAPYILSPAQDPDGYLHLRVYTDTKEERKVKVHQLVLEAFVGPRRPGQQTRHLDGDPANNCLENLRWGTPSENQLDILRHGTHFHRSKSHCPRGHVYDDANTVIRPQGWRECRICLRARQAAYRDRIRAAANEDAA